MSPSDQMGISILLCQAFFMTLGVLSGLWNYTVLLLNSLRRQAHVLWQGGQRWHLGPGKILVATDYQVDHRAGIIWSSTGFLEGLTGLDSAKEPCNHFRCM
jgi:hypothetical protein